MASKTTTNSTYPRPQQSRDHRGAAPSPPGDQWSPPFQRWLGDICSTRRQTPEVLTLQAGACVDCHRLHRRCDASLQCPTATVGLPFQQRAAPLSRDRRRQVDRVHSSPTHKHLRHLKSKEVPFQVFIFASLFLDFLITSQSQKRSGV